MDTQQIWLVQRSFSRLAQIQGAPAAFYQRLFELDPALRPMFKGSIEEQGRKLMHVLSAAVHSLHDFDTLLPTVRSLGIRHRSYGIEDRHYDTVGEALMWTLEKALGADFTGEVRSAWAETYRVLANVMKASASRHGLAPTEGVKTPLEQRNACPINARRACQISSFVPSSTTRFGGTLK